MSVTPALSSPPDLTTYLAEPQNDPHADAEALLRAFTMIIFSEIGDKTFLIAALLAMRHPRMVVFMGALASLLLMSLLSASMGHLLPFLAPSIPPALPQAAAGALFLVFGARMAREGAAMQGGSEKVLEEMREAADEIKGDEEASAGGGAMELESVERGEGEAVSGYDDTDVTNSKLKSKSKSKSQSRTLEGARNFCALLLGPVFVQAFVLTFLGEWGDRSQIATIALGAAHNVPLVTLGTVLGHGCCTALAVIGGRYVSTKISVKAVTLGGAALFVVFGVIYLYEALASTSAAAIPISVDGITA
ncbi:UPF0016-domain-containing protein [Leucogyrophana mollusca]|uniref:UPF0016-domain-containing protein n=1 Tax=Leucogyrophana mollusca TaxID=85980 RepID=A0ACB8B4Z6_9AGAM|nr:UPF0016-domain-containing protein [Leucogyrophana mollusca]